jgi:hypothetical protein
MSFGRWQRCGSRPWKNRSNPPRARLGMRRAPEQADQQGEPAGRDLRCGRRGIAGVRSARGAVSAQYPFSGISVFLLPPASGPWQAATLSTEVLKLVAI